MSATLPHGGADVLPFTGCDGYDSHRLGWSRSRWLSFSAPFVLALAAEIALHLPTGLMIVTGAHALAGLIALGIGMRLDGPFLVVQRLGIPRRTALPGVSQVDRYSSGGATSLRLRSPGTKRAAYIRVSGAGGRLDQPAARHLLRYLDRPDVSWGPGAWELLSARAGTMNEAVGSTSPTGPVGVKRPRTRKQQISQRLALLVTVLATAIVLVLTPISWHHYLEARSVQDGPEVQATLQSGWVQAFTDSHGTHHTTHFTVNFTTQNGQPVQTSFTAPGLWRPLDPGAPVAIHYDPQNPNRAALPGEQSAPLTESLLLTATTVLLLLPWVIVGYMRWWRPRRGAI